MGYVVDHWITVTGTNRGELDLKSSAEEQKKYQEAWGSPVPVHRAREIALAIFAPEGVSAVMPAARNNQEHLCICPDSSKSGWDEASNGHQRRAKFIASLVNARIRERLIVGFTVFGLGEDGDRATATVMHHRDPFFDALQEGEAIAKTFKRRCTDPYGPKCAPEEAFSLENALTPLDVLVPGNDDWRATVRRLWAKGVGPTVDILSAEVMVFAQLLDIPDKYKAIGTPDQLGQTGQKLYKDLLSDAKTQFPGVVRL